MPLFVVGDKKLEAVPDTSYQNEGILERKHLQTVLKQTLIASECSPLGDDLKLICEEFCDWEDSGRRIDLLCIDKESRIVVVELKRTEDGGHMELQAIRYAAMISSLTLEQAINAHARFLVGDDAQVRARKEILDFLEVETTEEVELQGDVRIILAAANFSSELVTSVLWLNKQGLDITCVRLKPYKIDDRLLIDATQIVPLPEAASYEIRIRQKQDSERKVKSVRQEIFRRFWATLIERSRLSTSLLANRSTTTDSWISAGIGRAGFSLTLALTEERARVDCFIRLKEGEAASLAAFQTLLAQRKEIEATFGNDLDWQDLPGRLGFRICKDFDSGWKTPESEWANLQDKMIDGLIRLEKALRAPIHALD